MQISIDKKMKHRNEFKVFRIPKCGDLYSRVKGIKIPNSSGLVDDDGRLLDNINRTNIELNSEAYEYYSKVQNELDSKSEGNDHDNLSQD